MTLLTPASRRPARNALALIGVGALVLLADQGSKALVQQHFATCDAYSSDPVVPDWLAVTYTCNHGAAFGILASQTLLFVLIAVVVSGVIVAYLRFLPTNRPWLRLSLGLQLGGALGNLLDRLRQGYVVDFIAVKELPVFNIADSCIVVGVLILAYYLLATNSPPTAAPRANAQVTPSSE